MSSVENKRGLFCLQSNKARRRNPLIRQCLAFMQQRSDPQNKAFHWYKLRSEPERPTLPAWLFFLFAQTALYINLSYDNWNFTGPKILAAVWVDLGPYFWRARLQSLTDVIPSSQRGISKFFAALSRHHLAVDWRGAQRGSCSGDSRSCVFNGGMEADLMTSDTLSSPPPAVSPLVLAGEL